MQRGFSVVFIIVIMALVFVGGAYFAYAQNFQNVRQIHSYEDCAKAGYPVLLSYPGQCNTPDGQHYVQELSEEEKKKLVPPSLGSNQICAQVIQPAKNSDTGECKEFSTPCDVPEGWDKVSSCNSDVMSDGTYVNKDLGFSFNTLGLSYGNVSLWAPKTAKGVTCFVDKKTVVIGSDAPFDGFCIYIDPNLDQKTVDKYEAVQKEVLNGVSGDSTGSDKKILVDGVSGIDLIGASIFGTNYVFLPILEDNSILILVRLSEKGNSFESKFKEILSSFKFLK